MFGSVNPPASYVQKVLKRIPFTLIMNPKPDAKRKAHCQTGQNPDPKCQQLSLPLSKQVAESRCKCSRSDQGGTKYASCTCPTLQCEIVGFDKADKAYEADYI